jgi:hypothetical protein
MVGTLTTGGPIDVIDLCFGVLTVPKGEGKRLGSRWPTGRLVDFRTTACAWSKARGCDFVDRDCAYAVLDNADGRNRRQTLCFIVGS